MRYKWILNKMTINDELEILRKKYRKFGFGC